MTLVALCSASGAPGVTTTALALGWAWPAAHPGRRSLVVDADVAGSGILTGCLQVGVPDGAGVLALAGSRKAPDDVTVLEHAVSLDAESARMVLPGLTDPTQARPLADVWAGVAGAVPALGASGVDLLADVGRLGHRDEPAALLERANTVVLVLRATLPQVSAGLAAWQRLRTLRGPSARAEVLVVGVRPAYPTKEVARALGVATVHELPEDRRAAAVLSDGGSVGWAFERSALLRAARSVAADVGAPRLARVAASEVPA